MLFSGLRGRIIQIFSLIVAFSLILLIGLPQLTQLCPQPSVDVLQVELGRHVSSIERVIDPSPPPLLPLTAPPASQHVKNWQLETDDELKAEEKTINNSNFDDVADNEKEREREKEREEGQKREQEEEIELMKRKEEEKGLSSSSSSSSSSSNSSSSESSSSSSYDPLFTYTGVLTPYDQESLWNLQPRALEKDEYFNYIHIPKTGGITMRAIIPNAGSRPGIFNVTNCGLR
jgi:hypothetical protein